MHFSPTMLTLLNIFFCVGEGCVASLSCLYFPSSASSILHRPHTILVLMGILCNM